MTYRFCRGRLGGGGGGDFYAAIPDDDEEAKYWPQYGGQKPYFCPTAAPRFMFAVGEREALRLSVVRSYEYETLMEVGKSEYLRALRSALESPHVVDKERFLQAALSSGLTEDDAEDLRRFVASIPVME